MPSDPDRAAKRVWITRAQPRAEATAARLRALGFTPVVAPVLETLPIAGLKIDLAGVDALAFTSAAGVAAFAALSPARSGAVFTVGDATGEAARLAGFSDVRSAKGDVQALADMIAGSAPRPALVLNPSAAEPAADLASLLARRGLRARSVAVYETRETDIAAPPAVLAAVLIHSARAARAVARLVAYHDLSDLAACAISSAAAAPLAAAGFGRITVAAEPTEAAVLSLLSR